MMGMEERIKKHHQRIHLLLRTLKRILKKDDYYIDRVLQLGEDIDLVEISHNGTVDYGKVVYLIKENAGNEGFCATLRFMLGFLLYAEQHGFLPKIKFSKEYAYYDEDMNKKIGNPWEYYFIPSSEACDESKALNICYAKFFHMMKLKEYPWLDAYVTDNYYNKDLFHSSAPVIRKYLALKPEILQEAEDLLKEIRERGGKILGVHFRGTDFKQGFNQHPVYVDEKQTIAEIRKAMEKTEFSAVFLATDDVAACKRIRDAIKDARILMYADVFRSDNDTSVAFSKSDRKYHHYLLGYEIARDMYTLSLCDGLVAGKSSVSYLSNLYKHSRDEEYEYMKIIDNGNNVNENSFADMFKGN